MSWAWVVGPVGPTLRPFVFFIVVEADIGSYFDVYARVLSWLFCLFRV